MARKGVGKPKSKKKLEEVLKQHPKSHTAWGRRRAAAIEARKERKARVRAQKKDGTFVPKDSDTVDKLAKYDDDIVDTGGYGICGVHDKMDLEEVKGEALEGVLQEEALDEFADYFAGKTTPKLLVTTSRKPSKKLITFIKEISCCLPNCFYHERKKSDVRFIAERALGKGYSDLLVFTEKRNILHGLYVVHLPSGPTMHFRISNLLLAQDIPGNVNLTTHNPELIMKNFHTKLGRRMARQLHSLFPLNPEFTGRRVITFHNQRDFIFFRHYRYIFDGLENNDMDDLKADLAEIGPRFTLKIRSIQEGLFDSVKGKREFVWKPKMQVDRTQMYV